MIINQKSHQTASSKVEKDFYKLLNNSNFGIDCQNNIGNRYLEPIYDDVNKISYIKRYTTIFSHKSLRDFFLPYLLRKEIEQTFQGKIFALNKEDQTYEARKKYLDRKKEEELDTVNSFEKKQKSKKKENFKLMMKNVYPTLTLEKPK